MGFFGEMTMEDDRKTPELLNLLNIEEGGSGDRCKVDEERMESWAQAFQDWIGERRARFNPKIGERSHLAWREFLAFTGKAPWKVRTVDVDLYVAQLEKRGLRAGTIANRLAGLSTFYQYCQEKGVDLRCETAFNPVKQARHPSVEEYKSANYLSRAEEAALLEAIQRDPSPMGKRDYALILMLLRTGWKAGPVRKLRWEGLAPDTGGLPAQVWEAVREYLQATGRWETIQPEEYVFAPSRAPLVREARERADDWAGSRPLSPDELHYLVKLHAGRAGLKAKRITCHTLRHTAAMRRVESGATAEAVGAFLGRERYHTTTYLKKLETQPKERLRARKTASAEEQTPSRAPCRTKPGNHLALQHGLTAKYLPEFEWLAEQGVELPEIDWVILRYRIVMRRAMLVGEDVRTLEEAMRILKVMGIAAYRLVRAVKLKQELGS
jgi:integrase